MKVKLERIGPALDRPTTAVRLFLLHGPDEAGAMALTNRLARVMGADAERVQLDGATLRADPALLADEAAAISLFGGARWIRVTAAGDESVSAVEALLAAPVAGSPVVMIAPAVRTTAKIVKVAEASDLAMSFGCYVPDERQGESIAADLARAAGLRLGRGVGRRLFVAADGDRAIMASEIDKLALYLDAAPDRPRDADEAALAAIGAGEAEADVDALVAAVLAGAPRDVAERLAALANADASPIPWLRALGRRLIALAEIRGRIDGGEAVEAATARVHFREKTATFAALRRLSSGDLAALMTAVRASERDVMASGAAGIQLAAHGLLALARG